MDYEKKYKEALERAKVIYQGSYKPDTAATIAETLQNVFPELCESEDERIRKELIEHVKDQQSSFISAPDCRDKYEEEENNKYNSWLAWLEKQGKQKPAWSEEDEKMMNSFLHKVEVCNLLTNKENVWIINKLKSLKQRIGG